LKIHPIDIWIFPYSEIMKIQIVHKRKIQLIYKLIEYVYPTHDQR